MPHVCECTSVATRVKAFRHFRRHLALRIRHSLLESRTISKYAPPASSGMQLPRVLLGNNDVHFMWLAPVTAQALPGPELSQ